MRVCLGSEYSEYGCTLLKLVQPGGKIEVIDMHLPAGQAVEVIVLLPSSPAIRRRLNLEVLAEASGHLAGQTADEVDAYLRAERNAWER